MRVRSPPRASPPRVAFAPRLPGINTKSEVGHPAFERPPHIGGPASAGATGRKYQPIVFSLPEIEQVFGVQKNTHAAEATLCHGAYVHVRFARRSIRIIIECLPARVIEL